MGKRKSPEKAPMFTAEGTSTADGSTRRFTVSRKGTSIIVSFITPAGGLGEFACHQSVRPDEQSILGEIALVAKVRDVKIVK